MIKPKTLRDLLYYVFITILSNGKIAKVLLIGTNTVRRHRIKANDLCLDWGKVEKLADSELMNLFHPAKRGYQKVLPACKSTKKPKNGELVWERYCEEHPDSHYSYSHYMAILKKLRKKLMISMHFEYERGEVIFIDFTGFRLYYTHPFTKQKVYVEIFVAVLGYSQYSFFFAVASQKVRDFVFAIAEMFKFFGGVPVKVVLDNLRSGVTTPRKGSQGAVLNSAIIDISQHTNCYFEAARIIKPKDKVLAEIGAKHFKYRISKAFDGIKFSNIEELNTKLAIENEKYNQRPFTQRVGSRASCFAEEKKYLKPLNPIPYEYHEFYGPQQVGSQYHVKFDNHRYSVPYTYIGEQATIIATHSKVNILIDNDEVASHLRSYDKKEQWLTEASHQHPDHKFVSSLDYNGLIAWANMIGPYTAIVVEKQFENTPNTAFTPLLAGKKIQSLADDYSPESLEFACMRADQLHSYSVTRVKSLLKSKRYLKVLENTPVGNITLPNFISRGADYYSNL